MQQTKYAIIERITTQRKFIAERNPTVIQFSSQIFNGNPELSEIWENWNPKIGSAWQSYWNDPRLHEPIQDLDSALEYAMSILNDTPQIKALWDDAVKIDLYSTTGEFRVFRNLFDDLCNAHRKAFDQFDDNPKVQECKTHRNIVLKSVWSDFLFSSDIKEYLHQFFTTHSPVQFENTPYMKAYWHYAYLEHIELPTILKKEIEDLKKQRDNFFRIVYGKVPWNKHPDTDQRRNNSDEVDGLPTAATVRSKEHNNAEGTLIRAHQIAFDNLTKTDSKDQYSKSEKTLRIDFYFAIRSVLDKFYYNRFGTFLKFNETLRSQAEQE